MALHLLMAQVWRVRGCLGCTVSSGLRVQGTVQYVEEWQTEEDLRRRLTIGSFGELAALIETATTPPSVTFTLPGGTRGLDFIQEVLCSKT
jgi:hypothetical protein